MYGLLGHNINYSFSPQIHNLLFEYLRLGETYLLFSRSEDELESFIEYARENINGFNVTIPYKQTIIQFLDEVDEVSSILGVNTVTNINGKLVGTNTDYSGFKYLLEYEGINVLNKDVVILGDGASSKMIQYVLKDIVKSLTVVSLTPTRDQISYDQISSGHILINTTPVGNLNLEGQLPLSIERINCFDMFIDLSYNPLNTQLIIEANRLNKKTANGLSMLVSQALHSESIWQNDNNITTFTKSIVKELEKKKNVVLIGMPGCGKSTIGLELSKRLKRQFIDIDEAIVKYSNKAIPELFEVSEEHFRNIETIVTKDVSNKFGHIIACGGGVILKKENMDALAKNSIIIYIKRDLDDIIKTMDYTNRPLLETKEHINKTFKDRSSLYCFYSDLIIENNTINQVCEDIINKI